MSLLISESSGITIGFAVSLVGLTASAVWQYWRDRSVTKGRIDGLENKVSDIAELAYSARQDAQAIKGELNELKDDYTKLNTQIAQMNVKLDRLIEDVRSLLTQAVKSRK